MITDYRSLSPQDSIRRAVELILAGSQQDFPVVSGQRVEGVLLRGDLLAALTQRGQDAPVAEIMRRDFLVVDSAEMLETAFTRLQACNCHTIPVTHAGRLVGLVTMDNLGEFMLIQAAVGRTRNLQPAAA
jgi:predicted transcriptional regulator